MAHFSSQCPARIAALIQADITMDAVELSRKTGLLESTAANYLALFRAGKIRDSNWRCVRCGRHESEVPRKKASPVCSPCLTELKGKGLDFCYGCHQERIASSIRRVSYGKRCTACVPVKNSPRYALDQRILELLKKKKMSMTVRTIAEFLKADQHQVRQVLRRLLRLKKITFDKHAFPYRYSLKP